MQQSWLKMGKMVLCSGEVLQSEKPRNQRRPQRPLASSGESMETWTKTQQIHIRNLPKTARERQFKSSMWLLDRKLNVANPLPLLPLRLRLSRHPVQEQELEPAVKVQSKFLQANPSREELCRQRNHYRKIRQFHEMHNTLRAEDHQVHNVNKAWLHHPDLVETYLDPYPTLTTSQHTLRHPFPLPDQIPVVQ
jgi:hypothetical protein